MIKIKSIYSRPHPDDGHRVLVDLFWPEGLKTREAAVDEWNPELGPSYDLQRFGFDITKWDDYKNKYKQELHQETEKKLIVESIAERNRNQTVTLLFGNKDAVHNHAVILKELLDDINPNAMKPESF